MNELVVVQSLTAWFGPVSVARGLDTDTINQIAKIENRSDPYISRLRIYFKNGLQLSVIQGAYTYGSESNLFEIAIMDWHGEMLDSLWDDEDDRGDTVCGHCSVEKVHHYIKKVSQLPSKDEVELPF